MHIYIHTPTHTTLTPASSSPPTHTHHHHRRDNNDSQQQDRGATIKINRPHDRVKDEVLLRLCVLLPSWLAREGPRPRHGACWKGRRTRLRLQRL